MRKFTKNYISMILSILIILSCVITPTVNAADNEKIVYLKNSTNWEQVYCYMWDNKGTNANWPGELMKNEKGDIWSYSINNNYTNIIFNNGFAKGDNQTLDLVLPGNGYIYDVKTQIWSEYNPKNPPEITVDKPNNYKFIEKMDINISVNYATSSYYTINDGEKINFENKISLVIGGDSQEEKDYTIKIYSVNENGTDEKTFTYKKINPTHSEIEVTLAPEFAESNALYVHSSVNAESKETWQKWENLTQQNLYYFFLPQTASNNEVEIYNTFSNSIIINNMEIPPCKSGIVSYIDGEAMSVYSGSFKNEKQLIIYKSDSEVSLYINDTKGEYIDEKGKVTKDFYSFLAENKNNFVSGSDCAIIDENGLTNTTLKKIKGRGNTTWTFSDKKPFNINFDNKTNIGGISSKKFSLLSNPKDGTLLRNRIMYDLADEVGSLYSSDSRNVDLYINGVYRGAYQITQKVELGKNSLVALKDESDKLTENFNFLIEVDIWNYAGDTNFKTKKGLHVVCKSPDLEGYDGTDETLNAQYNYIKNKYQEFEDALYNGNMSQLEQICDVDSLATAYLLQEFGKNCDGGMTSCFFTYDVSKGKFIADPIWDCDSCLGNVNCTRKNATNTAYSTGWAIKTAQYDNTSTVNVLGQAFKLSGKTENNENFEDVVKRIWNKKFIPAIAVLKGNNTSTGNRLKSVEEYKNISPKSAQINYLKWEFGWFPYYENLGGNYKNDLDGQITYMYDWLVAREKWMSSQLYTQSENPTTPTSPTNPTTPTNPPVTIDRDYYLTGLGFDGWGAKNYPLTKSSDGTYYADVTFKKGTEYKFKIFDGDQIYYTANVFDETTAQYINLVGVHENAYIVPQEDLDVRVILKGESFTIVLKKDIEFIFGDVDNSGVVNIMDVTTIQRYMANYIDFDEKSKLAADVNCDGVVDITDVTNIQLYLAMLIEKLPVK